MVRYRPLGPVLAVMPWNFPLWQVVRFAAPALMAGNVALLKHASNVPQTALLAGGRLPPGGLPRGCFQTLLIGSAAVEGVIRDPRVAAVTLTGSEAAGRSVAAIAGDEVKKTVLELGGSDPFLVLPSADIARAAQVAVHRQGAEQRPVLHRGQALHRAPGRPRGLRRRLRRPDGRAPRRRPGRGGRGRRATGHRGRPGRPGGAGGRRRAPGRHGRVRRPPTGEPPRVVLRADCVDRDHPGDAGPPGGVLRAGGHPLPGGGPSEALALANDTPFGLSSNAWTRDPEEQRLFARDLQAGAVFFNGMTASHPALPFGGVKRSGYGRELRDEGIREFCNLKRCGVR